MTRTDALHILRATDVSDLYEGYEIRAAGETGDESELREIEAAARFFGWTVGADEDGCWVLDEQRG